MNKHIYFTPFITVEYLMTSNTTIMTTSGGDGSDIIPGAGDPVNPERPLFVAGRLYT